MPGPEERATIRRRKLLNLRRARGGVFGLSYGISAFGYPLGDITGVQTPTDPPVSPDQFGDIGGGAATGGSTDSGTSADSGGAAP